MRRIATLLMTTCCLLVGLQAQTLTRETLDQVKSASVFVRVTHHFPLTGDEVSGSGSGFFISGAGHVITNYHVIQPMITAYGVSFPTPVKEVEIIRNSGKPDHQIFKGKIIAVDKEHDLALIGVDPGEEKLPFLQFEPTESLVELTPIWVFGFPFGEEFSVVQRGPEISITKGAITALRHDDLGVLDKVQVDAVVNKGNSGGPAVNEAGKVVGVVNMRYGDSRVNFAVPAHFASELVDGVRLEASVTAESRLRFDGDPDSAEVFVDWKPVELQPGGVIPVTNGHHTICVVSAGHDAYLAECVVDGPKSILVDMQPNKDLTIGPLHTPSEMRGGADFPKLSAKNAPPTTDVLLDETFANKKDIKNWEQTTGGEEKRTWYIDDGILNQHESDGTLHGIYMGEREWSDYMVQARVRINNEENDSRAGLIFRETEEGFYLFRIHRESDKAQLAYHSKGPFGWFVIQEKVLEKDIADQWHDLAVYAVGKQIVCFLDGDMVFNTCADYSQQGRVGFYSVESKASFDDLRVKQATPTMREVMGDNRQCGLRSFWFSDYFNLESTWWFGYEPHSGKPSPWAFGEGGCAVEFDDEVERICEFTRYRMDNFEMNLVVSVGKPSKKSEFGLIFRKAGSEHLALEFSAGDEEIRLISVNGKKRKVLHKEPLGSEFFDSSNVLKLTVDDQKIKCESFDSTLLEYDGTDLRKEAGRLAFSASQVRLVLHQMTINSVAE